MRMSQLFGHTLREPPADAEMVSHRLLVRAGFVRPLAAGLYTYLPLGQRVARRIEAIMREEMEAIGAQEMLMPVLHPAELWQATGRWETAGPALMRLKDRAGRAYALAMTHEEVVAELARREVRSYRDLPRVVYHIQTKLRDEPRPRGGLLRVREFRMKDAYSLHTDSDDLDRFYPQILGAYHRIFTRCGLDFIQVEADTGMMGGADSHEFLLPHPAGEDRLLHCSVCDYAANVEWATFRLPEVGPHPLEEPCPVATPGCATIADVAAFVGVPTNQTLKAVFYAWERPGGRPEMVFVVLRGDLEVNETKLLNLLGGGDLRAATDEEIRAAGAEPGYGSPVGLPVREHADSPGLLVVGDRSIQVGANFVAGANREGYHLTGVNYPRDFSVTLLADIAQAQEGHLCPRCGGSLLAESAIELGHCFKLGTRYSESLGVTYLDATGKERPVVMGSYSIGVGRLMAAVVEAHHDEHGIVWPPSLAPFDVHLLLLGRQEVVQEAAEETYRQLHEAGLSVLYDDRNESAGVKFADADLIGCPVRVTVGRRSLEAGGAEMKARRERDRQTVGLEDLPDQVAGLLDRWARL
ncbi:MAG TPA: proline--tRNA ligase [Anaerolineales bacterium]|nr:proline--tRNA ligase [Anaerolineae bacterium]HIQ00956.1 proline--tRNA ligase [Anaerolineales bacterium]